MNLYQPTGQADGHQKMAGQLSRKSLLFGAGVLASLSLVLVACSVNDAPAERAVVPSAVTDEAAYNYVLPVRVHMMDSDVSEIANSTFSDDQVRHLFAGANAIWKQAGVKWEIESIVRQEAINGAEFQRLMSSDDRDLRRRTLHSVYSMDNELENGWDVVFVNSLTIAGGTYVPTTGVVVMGEINGRGTATNPTILAHELGHSLSLPHLQLRDNLMASRQPGVLPEDKTNLTPAQIEMALKSAATGLPSLPRRQRNVQQGNQRNVQGNVPRNQRNGNRRNQRNQRN